MAPIIIWEGTVTPHVDPIGIYERKACLVMLFFRSGWSRRVLGGNKGEVSEQTRVGVRALVEENVEGKGSGWSQTF